MKLSHKDYLAFERLQIQRCHQTHATWSLHTFVINQTAKSIYADEATAKADEHGAPTYRLPEMSESARKQLFDTLARDLRDASNDQVANAIVADLNENMAFSYMGRCDVIFLFTQYIVSEMDGSKPDRPNREYVDPNDADIQYQYINPKTGFLPPAAR